MTEGYVQKDFGKRTQRYCQTMELRDDTELIRRYCEAHDEPHFRPEVLAGMREVGIMEMEVYIVGTRLVMIVDAPEDFNWDEAMARLATLPGQEDWEAYVAQFQQCDANATSDQKWQMMKRIFHIYDK
ncbi:MAG: L-rhamnose mutarotase [Bacteroidaceae bacterium]|nr:L-rhamnose mutarotase [Bacteroidaceae bacterium]